MGFSLFAELEKMEIMTLPNWFLTVAIIISVSTVFILIFVPEVRQTGQKSEDRKLTEDVESVDNDAEYSHLSESVCNSQFCLWEQVGTML